MSFINHPVKSNFWREEIYGSHSTCKVPTYIPIESVPVTDLLSFIPGDLYLNVLATLVSIVIGYYLYTSDHVV